MIPDEILQKIDDETDIVALVSEFVSLEKRGKNYLGLCPFHDEKTPSFSVTPEKNIAKCMGCGEGGRPINFYRKIKNVSFREAVHDLGARLGIEIDYDSTYESTNEKYYEIMAEASNFYTYNLFNSVSGEKVLNYLSRRELSTETIKHFRIGYSASDKDQLYQFLKSKDYSVTDMIDLGLVKQSKDGSYYDLFNNRLMFPITNSYGKVVAFSGRTLDKNDKVKYVNSPETVIFKKGETLYQLNEANLEIRKKQFAIIYEGFFDVISAHQAGFMNGIATMGTALTVNQAQLLKRTTNKVVIAYDGDNAGVKATMSAIPLLRQVGLEVNVLAIPDKLDPDDYIKTFHAEGYQKLLEEKISDPYHYQYEHFIKGIDLNNANDIKTFQTNVTNMLKYAPAAVVALYKKRLAKDLSINENQVKIVRENKHAEIPFEELPQNKRKKLPTRYEQAEKWLLILMFRSRIWFERITDAITIHEYSTVLLGSIRTKLTSYYNQHESFDLQTFLSFLNIEEKSYVEENVFTEKFWQDQTNLTEDDIYYYVMLLKETPKVRRIEHLKDVMLEKNKAGHDITRETEEYRNLKKEIEKLKENINGNR